MPAEKEIKACLLQVKEEFTAKRSATDVFAQLILAEYRNATIRHWTETQSQVIINPSTVKS